MQSSSGLRPSPGRAYLAEYCSARSETIPPLPWTHFSPPFPLQTVSNPLKYYPRAGKNKPRDPVHYGLSHANVRRA